MKEDDQFLTFDCGDEDIQLTAYGAPHFNSAEFRCKCGCYRAVISRDLITTLEYLRSRTFGFPLIIQSGYRCPDHNRRIKGAVRKSGHTIGVAADVRTPRHHDTVDFAWRIWHDRDRAGVKRVGSYDGYSGKFGFVHVGVRRKFLGKKHLSPRWGDWEVHAKADEDI